MAKVNPLPHVGVKELLKGPDGVLLPFETQKHKYQIIRPGDPLGIKKWTQYENLKIVVGTGKSFAALEESLREIEKGLAQEGEFATLRLEAIHAIHSLRMSILENSKARFGYALYLATIFTYREGSDPLEWSLPQAEEYISDWQDFGVNEHDLFFFALSTIDGFKKIYRDLREELRVQEEKLLAFTGKRTEESITS